MINREISSILQSRLTDAKAIVVLGPRQAGKSTLLKALAPEFAPPVLWWNGDDADLRADLAVPNASLLKGLVGHHRTLVIDEAQRIADIGMVIKILHDSVPDIKVIATGSSAFELANRLNEPLTGRKWEFLLYPFSLGEMCRHTSEREEQRLLTLRLIYGYYPEIVLHPGEEAERLKELSSNYLYKDILTWERIRKPDRMERLVQALALQVGSEVSYHELGQLSGLDNQTIEKYIDLLEKAFIVFRLHSLSRNLRNELKKSRKIYFLDNGIRNAVINNFNPIALRQDAGALWENFLMSERRKALAYRRDFRSTWFWRTAAQQEVDYVEEKDGRMQAWEFKWNPHKKVVVSKAFTNAYPEAETGVITPENAVGWLQTM